MSKSDGASTTSAAILAFPLQTRDAAAILAYVERLPTADLLPTAHRGIAAVPAMVGKPELDIAAAHTLFVSLLCVVRLLDAIRYPWEGLTLRLPEGRV